jgi:hypothetical protein
VEEQRAMIKTKHFESRGGLQDIFALNGAEISKWVKTVPMERYQEGYQSSYQSEGMGASDPTHRRVVGEPTQTFIAWQDLGTSSSIRIQRAGTEYAIGVV